MTSRDFAFWLQGFFEISDLESGDQPQGLNAAQTASIQKHLALVFKHEIDPSMGDEEHQKALNAIHNTKTEETTDEIQNPPFIRPSQPGWIGEDGAVMRC